MISCPFVNQNRRCILEKKECNCFKYPTLCDIYNKHNPIGIERGLVICDRVKKVLKKLGLDYSPIYEITNNIPYIVIKNELKTLISFVDDFEFTPYEVIKDIKNYFLVAQSKIIETSRDLTVQEQLDKVMLGREIKKVLTEKVVEKEEINIKLISSDKTSNTAMIEKNGETSLYFINTDIKDFLKNFSVEYFLKYCEHIEKNTPTELTIRELYIHIKNNLSEYKNIKKLEYHEGYFHIGDEKHKYVYNDITSPYFKMIAEVLGFVKIETRKD